MKDEKEVLRSALSDACNIIISQEIDGEAYDVIVKRFMQEQGNTDWGVGSEDIMKYLIDKYSDLDEE